MLAWVCVVCVCLCACMCVCGLCVCVLAHACMCSCRWNDLMTCAWPVSRAGRFKSDPVRTMGRQWQRMGYSMNSFYSFLCVISVLKCHFRLSLSLYHQDTTKSRGDSCFPCGLKTIILVACSVRWKRLRVGSPSDFLPHPGLWTLVPAFPMLWGLENSIALTLVSQVSQAEILLAFTLHPRSGVFAFAFSVSLAYEYYTLIN